ncbi:MAG: lytic transglycosylase domain-containing protein [Clostridia bacterium]|nr:lytic transglycosylase domain-containing protein [Clostridia bacterium]
MQIIRTESPRGRWKRGLLLTIAAVAGAALLIVCGRLFLKSAYPLRYEDAVRQAANTYDIPASLIYAVIRVESGFDPNAVSHADARGLMQITSDTLTWSRYRLNLPDDGSVDLFDPDANIQTGTHVLSLLCEQYESIETVLAAYNAGIGTVGKWLRDPACSTDGMTLEHIPYPETDAYVRRVLETKKRYEFLYPIQCQEVLP